MARESHIMIEARARSSVTDHEILCMEKNIISESILKSTRFSGKGRQSLHIYRIRSIRRRSRLVAALE